MKTLSREKLKEFLNESELLAEYRMSELGESDAHAFVMWRANFNGRRQLAIDLLEMLDDGQFDDDG